MRDRLIDLSRKAKLYAQEKADERGGLVCIDDEVDYLLANGVIVPPIEVGQTVWYVDDFTEEIEECKVYGFTVVNGKLSLLVDNGECKFVTRKWCNTKEEAEKALAERSEGNE